MIILLSFMFLNTTSSSSRAVIDNSIVTKAEKNDTKKLNKRKQQKKQRTSVTYDFSCLSTNGDIGSNDAIYNFGEITREVQSSFFDNIDISKVGNVYRVSVLVSGSKEKVQEVHKRVKVYHKSAWISYK